MFQWLVCGILSSLLTLLFAELYQRRANIIDFVSFPDNEMVDVIEDHSHQRPHMLNLYNNQYMPADALVMQGNWKSVNRTRFWKSVNRTRFIRILDPTWLDLNQQKCRWKTHNEFLSLETLLKTKYKYAGLELQWLIDEVLFFSIYYMTLVIMIFCNCIFLSYHAYSVKPPTLTGVSTNPTYVFILYHRAVPSWHNQYSQSYIYNIHP